MGLKEGLVECSTVCVKSEVILPNVPYISKAVGMHLNYALAFYWYKIIFDYDQHILTNSFELS